VLREEEKAEIEQVVKRLVKEERHRTWSVLEDVLLQADISKLSNEDFLLALLRVRQFLDTATKPLDILPRVHESLVAKWVEAERVLFGAASVIGAGQTASTSAIAPADLGPLVEIIARAIDVLGTREKALRWLNAPVRSLGDQTPVSLLDTPEGVSRVEDALGRIEHGVW